MTSITVTYATTFLLPDSTEATGLFLFPNGQSEQKRECLALINENKVNSVGHNRNFTTQRNHFTLLHSTIHKTKFTSLSLSQISKEIIK